MYLMNLYDFFFRGLHYNTILCNLLNVFIDPSNLVLVINSSEHEEKFLIDQFKLSTLPNLGTDRYFDVWD